MEYKGTELYVRDGKIGILVSPGYGAGWSTWGDRRLSYDKRVIDFWMRHIEDERFMQGIRAWDENDARREARMFFESIGYENPYMGGYNDIVLKFVSPNVPWRIDEYDGWESLITFDDEDYIVF